MIDLVCWDFGDTLVDERWMRTTHPDHGDWERDYDRVISGNAAWVEQWERGLVPTGELVARIATATGLPPASIDAHFERACRSLTFFPTARRALVELRAEAAAACITVNPDVFTRFVVPAYDLTSLFDVIVTSWETGEVHKSAIARIARSELSLGNDLSTTLLIDNRVDNVEEFLAAGGVAYHFRGDDVFASDYTRGLAGLLDART